jgi:hypothetical protein
MNRAHWSILFLAAIVLFLGIRWLLAPPTVTLNFIDAPLDKVIAAIEKQARITIRTSMDPETLITMQIRRAPVMEALDLLAVRADANLRLGYVLGPDKQTVREGVELLVASRQQREGWKSFYFPTDQWVSTLEPPDPRSFRWNVEAMQPGSLADYLGQGSQKLPVQLFAPSEFVETIVPKPASGVAAKVLKSLLRPLKGESREVFVLTGGWGGRGNEQTTVDRPIPDGNRGRSGDAGWGGDWGGRSQSDSPNNQPNPAWIEERTGQLIAALPPEDRDPARAQAEEFRSWREELAGLDGDARREAARVFFSRPEVQERIEENMAVRDAKRTPAQREARYRRTADRRIEAREAAGNPLVARP